MNFEIARKRMVEEVVARGICDVRVIDAMRRVPRHIFVEEAMAGQSYSDSSLPIGEKQTISQPYMVALMTQLLELKGNEKVLELGTGSGYQAAILAVLAEKVCTVERIRSLALRARKALDSLRLLNVNMRIGDGTTGWPEEAPFDAVLVTAGAPEVPEELVKQLKPGGRMIIPVGTEYEQKLIKIIRGESGSLSSDIVTDCRFVKLVGKQGWSAGEEKSSACL